MSLVLVPWICIDKIVEYAQQHRKCSWILAAEPVTSMPLCKTQQKTRSLMLYRKTISVYRLRYSNLEDFEII
jgi:hypothetical protein